MGVATFQGSRIHSIGLLVQCLSCCRSLVKASFILLPLLGVTWVFGLLVVNRRADVFAWVFTILNSLQGAFIFILHVLRNERVSGQDVHPDPSNIGHWLISTVALLCNLQMQGIVQHLFKSTTSKRGGSSSQVSNWLDHNSYLNVTTVAEPTRSMIEKNTVVLYKGQLKFVPLCVNQPPSLEQPPYK